MRLTGLWHIGVVAWLLALPTSSLALSTTWIYSGWDNWSDSSKWSNGEPGSSDEAIVVSAGPIISEDGETAGTLRVEGSTAQVSMVGGSLSTESMSIGTDNGNGAFYKSDGELNVCFGSIGTGAQGYGLFEQSGGSSSFFPSGLAIGGGGGQGTVRLQGGVINASESDTVVNDGGHLEQTGGSLWVEPSLCVAPGGTFTMGGGTLTVMYHLSVGGSMEITSDSTDITVHSGVGFWSGAQFSAVPGSRIRTIERSSGGAGLRYTSSDPVALEGLANLELVLQSGGQIEVGSRPGGGFVQNFALGALTIGPDGEAHATLIDSADNGNRDVVHECLFVKELAIGELCSLDLNMLWLYVQGDVEATLDGWIGDGRLFDRNPVLLDAVYDPVANWTYVIPEPTGLALLAMGAITAAGHHRRRSGTKPNMGDTHAQCTQCGRNTGTRGNSG